MSPFYPFAMERLMSKFEQEVDYNLSESGVHPILLGELLGDDPARLERLLATELTWTDQGGAVYDIAGDLLSTIPAEGGLSGTDCVAAGLATDAWQYGRPDPPSPDGYYYLVRGRNSCGDWDYGTDSDGADRGLEAVCP